MRAVLALSLLAAASILGILTTIDGVHDGRSVAAIVLVAIAGGIVIGGILEQGEHS